MRKRKLISVSLYLPIIILISIAHLHQKLLLMGVIVIGTLLYLIIVIFHLAGVIRPSITFVLGNHKLAQYLEQDVNMFRSN